MLPDQFLASAAARNWEVPQIQQVASQVPSALLYNALLRAEVPPAGKNAASAPCAFDPSVWLDWASALPENTPLQPCFDPGLLDRFSLVLRYPETDAIDEQVEAFEKRVWDHLAELYGTRGPNDGDGPSLEGVSVKHRTTVVAHVLDGLRWCGLTDQVKLICRQPDPKDWQRDRDVTLWPPEDQADRPA
jgi:hypothetical protein